MSRIRFMLLILMTTAGLAACGQSGPLYLPGNPSQVTTTPPEPAEAPDSDREREENGESDDE